MELFDAAKNGDVNTVVRYLRDDRYDNCLDPDGRTPLHYACMYGHKKLGEVLVKEFKVNVCKKDSKGLTPLQYACIREHMDIVKILAENSEANIVVPDQSELIPLHYACKCGHLDIVKRLSLELTDLAMRDKNGRTALMLAARGGHVDCALFLLHNYCQNNQMPIMWDNNGWTVLHHACAGGSLRIVKTLIIDYKADINFPNFSKDTLLHVAARKRQLEIVSALISDFECDPNFLDHKGQAVLHLACLAGDKEMVNTLLKQDKVKVNVRNKYRETPLHVALKAQHYVVVSALISHPGCNPNVLDGHRKSVLHLACVSGNLEVVQTLLRNNKLDVNVCSNLMEGRPLHVALRAQKYDVVLALISHPSCDHYAMDWLGQSVLHLACANGNLEVIQALLCDDKAQVNVRWRQSTPLHIAMRGQHYDAVFALISHPRCDPNVLDGDGKSVLYLACESGNLEVVQTLFRNNKLDVNVCSNLMEDMRPLHVAWRAQKYDVVLALISHPSCDHYAMDWSGQSVLHLACANGNLEVILALLCDDKAQVNVCTQWPRSTPLHIAMRGQHYDAVFALISHPRCDPNVLDGNGKSVLQLACESGKVEVVQALLRDQKLDVNVGSKGLGTPLHAAMKGQHYDVVFALISHPRCGLNVLDNNGLSVLHLACESGKLGVVQALLPDEKLDVNVCSKGLGTPLHAAMKGQHYDVVLALISHPRCDLNVLDDNGLSVLHLACESGKLGVVQALLPDEKLDVNVCSKGLGTPLHAAMKGQHYDVVLALISHPRCDLNVLDDNGLSVLHLACESGNLEVVQTLLCENKVDANVCNSENDTPLHVATNAGYYSIVLALLGKANCDPGVRGNLRRNALHVASIKGYNDITQALLKFASPLEADDDGNTPLHLACKSGNLEVVQTLLSEGKVDVNVFNSEKNTPLHVATDAGFYAIVAALLKRSNIDPSAKANLGRNALHLASKKGYNNITHALLKFISPLETDDYGNTPLHIASEYTHIHTISSLLHENAPVLIRNRRGLTPIDLACDDNSRLLFENYLQVNHQSIQNHYTKTLEKAKMRYSGAHHITRLFVLGNSGVGKSSFIESLKREGLFESLWKVSESSVPPHTAGIIPSVYMSREYGRVLFYDFAGDPEYYSSHAAIIKSLSFSKKGNNIFIVVVDLREHDVTIETTLFYWLSFIQFQKFRNPSLIVVGSHFDQSPENSRSIGQFCEVLHSCTYRSEHFLLDCRDPRSNQIALFKNQILTWVSKSCKYDISSEASLLLGLLEMDFSKVVACPVQILVKHIKDSGSWLPVEPKALQRVLSELHEIGVLLLLGDCTKDSDYVVLNIPKLTTEVHELLFSASALSKMQKISTKKLHSAHLNIGILSEDVLKACLPPHITTECLVHLQYCQKVTHEDLAIFPSYEHDDCTSQSFLFFPALCTTDKSQVSWNESRDNSFDIGWLALCADPYDYFPSRFLHVLLLRLVYRFALSVPTQMQDAHSSPELSRRCTMWKKGVYWKMKQGVDCMVELVNGSRGVVVAAKSSAERVDNCTSIFTKVVSCVMEAKAEFCHSIRPQFFFLDSSAEDDYKNQDHLFAISDIVDALESPEENEVIISVSGRGEMELSKLQWMRKFTHWGSLFPISIKEVLHTLRTVVKEVFDLGLCLKAPVEFLEKLDVNYLHDLDRRKMELVAWWFSSSSQDPPCWWTLAEALKDAERKVLAEEIIREHGLHIHLQEKLLSEGTQTIKPDWKFLDLLSGVVGPRWPSLAVSLALSEEEIEKLKEETDLSHQELALQMLHIWASKEEATYGQLCCKLKLISLF